MLPGVAVGVTVSVSAPAFAAANDYLFEPVNAQVTKGDDLILSVRLRHKSTGKIVTDAVIVRSRIDMAPLAETLQGNARDNLALPVHFSAHPD
jgi:hypothetical protein